MRSAYKFDMLDMHGRLRYVALTLTATIIITTIKATAIAATKTEVDKTTPNALNFGQR